MESRVGAPGIYPSYGFVFRRPLPSTGSLWSWFPRFTGTMRRSDFLSLIPDLIHLGFVSLPPVPSLFEGGKRQGLPSSWETSLCIRPALRPRRTFAPSQLRRVSAAARSTHGVGSRKNNFGAPSHGLCTRCLRFVAVVRPNRREHIGRSFSRPRKTRYRVVASLSRTGVVTC